MPLLNLSKCDLFRLHNCFYECHLLLVTKLIQRLNHQSQRSSIFVYFLLMHQVFWAQISLSLLFNRLQSVWRSWTIEVHIKICYIHNCNCNYELFSILHQYTLLAPFFDLRKDRVSRKSLYLQIDVNFDNRLILALIPARPNILLVQPLLLCSVLQ